MAALDHDVQSVSGLKPSTSTSGKSNLQNEAIEAFKDIAFGSTAGILGKFIEYPFDTVKGPIDAFAAAFRSPEGPIHSLYRGISAPLLGAAVETSCLFFSYRVAQEALTAVIPSLGNHANANGRIELPFGALLTCGAASGAFTSLFLTPIELIKCKMQVPFEPSHMASVLGYEKTRPQTPFALVASVFRSQGFLGFWHGQLGTLIRETGGSAAWFGSYEGIKMLFVRSDPNLKTMDDVKVWQRMSAGAVAGMAYNFVFYPADTIKSRMQTEETKVAASKTSFVKTGKLLWSEQGLRGFYRGCGITVFRAAPSSAVIFSIYEGLKRHFE